MTRRLEKVRGVIEQEISKVILYKLQDPRINLVTVTRVEPSPDLRVAKVYVAIQGDAPSQKKTLNALKHAKGYIQSEMASHLKLRNTPSLTFYLDEARKKSGHVLDLIEKAINEEKNIAENRGSEIMEKLRFGIPKGSLQEATIGMMKNAGYRVYVSSRSYYPTVDDDELSLRLIRPQDMSRYVEKGIIDAGLTGQDWVEEAGSDVRCVEKLVYAKQKLTTVRWVFAVPEDSPVKSVEDLQGKRISTELVNVTKRYLEERNIHAEVEFSHGATEAKAPDLVDAIVELTETGSSLRANNLRIIDTVTESATVFISNHKSWEDPWKKQKMENLAILFQGAIIARDKVGLKMNISNEGLNALLEKLPALRTPTVSPLSGNAGYAVETILDESVVRNIIPELKRVGAEGIIEYPLNKVIL
ncbi:MAG: ATP phosphoribosyltransferase [Planctomycetota bacterium]